jgi:adenylate kinase family enzyme
MNKIYIIGSVASGKTTLARELSRKLNISHYELDCIVHYNADSGRFKRTPEQQVEAIELFTQKQVASLNKLHEGGF